MMTTTLTPGEREQRIALCLKTYENLYGCAPDISELCEFLGNEYYPDILSFLKLRAELTAA